MKHKGILAIGLLLMCVLLVLVPLAMRRDTDFAGADGKAQDMITQIDPEYEPWAESLLELPGSETESLLFCIQAAVGGGVIGLGFGYFIGRSKREDARRE